MADRILLADTRVRFEVAPAQSRDGVVHAQMLYEGRIYYILKYEAGSETAFAVRLPGQFQIIKDC